MVVWWIGVLIYAGLTVVGELLKPRPKYQNASATPLGAFESPTATESRAVPVVFGTCHLKGPNVLWYGDYAASALKESVPSGFLGLGSKKVVTGYQYFLGFHYGLCAGPVDQVVELRFDDKPLPSAGIISAKSGANVLRVKKADFAAGATQSVTVPISAYDTYEALAVATETALKGVISADWKVVHGFRIVPGRTDAIVYSLTVGGVSTKYVVTVRGGVYDSGAKLGRAVAAALNAKEASIGARATFSCTYQASTGIFKITALAIGAVTAFTIYANVTAEFSMATTALVTLGFDTAVSSASSSYPILTVNGTFAVRPRQFQFALREDNGTLVLSDPLFTAKALFGFVYKSAADMTLNAALAPYATNETGTIYETIDSDTVRVHVQAGNLFGGERAEGGIEGDFDVHLGSYTQNANDYLAAKMTLQGAATTVPAWRGVCYLVARRPYIGTNLYIKPISVVVRRCPNTLGLAGGKHNLSGDANPAAMVYDILTDADWGLGISPSLIDASTFVACGNTLYTESLGLSIQYDTTQEAWDWIEEIMRHVDGVLYEDALTGLLSMQLARADYTVAALPLVDDSVATLEKFSRPAWEELRNSVKVTYIDRSADFMERVVKATDLASVAARGGDEVIEEIPFHGISNAVAAQKAAARALKAISFPMAQVELRANRSTWAFRPGDVFRWTWPPLGITDMPVRVLRIRGGNELSGEIAIDAAEDIFGVPWTAYTAPGAPVWTDPAVAPASLIASRADEVPYALLDAEQNRIFTLGVPDQSAQGLTMGYEVWTDPLNGDAFRQTEVCLNPTPSGTLSASLDPVATSFDITDGFQLDDITAHLTDQELAEGRHVLLIDSEAIAFQHFTLNGDGTWKVDGAVRGVWDTCPASHSSSARVWMVSGGMGVARPEEYPLGSVVAVKLLAFNRRGTFPIGDATELNVTIVQRSKRPVSPKGLTVNALAYPTNVNGDLTFAWKHRDRLAEWSYANAGEWTTIEAGCDYTIRIYNEVGTLQKTVTGITGLSYAYSAAQDAIDNPLGRANGILTFSIWAKRTSDGLESPTPLTDTFDCAGYGMLYGDYYGGAAG